MKTIKTTLLAVTISTLAGVAPATSAQTTSHHVHAGDVTVAAADMTDAEVRKVDQEQGKVTLKHGPIRNLDMPAMTMVFSVRDKALLAGVKPGDKVRFLAASENGQMIVTAIQPAR